MPAPEAFLDGYLEAALWTSTDDNDEPLDRTYSVSDFHPETIEKARKDCDRFFDECREALEATGAADDYSGHDFWLTRNRHGAGFWDRGYPEALGGALTEASHRFGEIDLHVGDDGHIH